MFVEVKSRATEDFGGPEAAVDGVKQQHLARAAAEYVRRSGWPKQAVRFDIVSVVFGEQMKISHIEDAFTIG